MRFFKIATLITAVAVLAGICAAAPPPPIGAPAPRESQNASQADEREQIWNSPDMTDARAWLDDYFAASAKVTPDEAKRYLDRLHAMTPDQMRLWLRRFNEQRQSRRQAESFFQQRQNELAQGLAARRQQPLAGAQYNRAIGGGALQAQQRIQSQQWLQNQMVLQRQTQTPYAYYDYGYMYGPLPFLRSGFSGPVLAVPFGY